MTGIDDRASKIELNAAALNRLRHALDQDGVVAGALVGSQATGRAGPLSDVDVAVWLDPSLPDRERARLALKLGADAGSALQTAEVDVVILNDATPLMRHRTRSQELRLVDRDPRQRVRLETRALLEYLDTASLREELARGLRNRLEEGTFGRR